MFFLNSVPPRKPGISGRHGILRGRSYTLGGLDFGLGLERLPVQ